VTRRGRELAEQIVGGLAAVELHASLAAVNEDAVAHLLVAHEGMIPGYVCGPCGALGTGILALRDQASCGVSGRRFRRCAASPASVRSCSWRDIRIS
jgi:hypothetical protein